MREICSSWRRLHNLKSIISKTLGCHLEESGIEINSKSIESLLESTQGVLDKAELELNYIQRRDEVYYQTNADTFQTFIQLYKKEKEQKKRVLSRGISNGIKKSITQ